MPFVEHTQIVEYNFQNGEYTCYILFLLVNGYISSGKWTVLGHVSIGNKVISKNHHLNTFFYPNLLLKKLPRYFLWTLIKPLYWDMWAFFRHSNYYKKILYFYSSSIRMSGKNIIFDDKKTNKNNFYKNKNYLIYMT